MAIVMPRHHRNVGGFERAGRLFVGAAAMASAAAIGAVWLKLILGLVGLALLITAVTAHCPVNQAVGRDSHRRPLS